MPSRVWMPADALAFRCPVESVGTLIPASEVLPASPMGLPPLQELERRVLLALLRLAEEGSGMAAVEASKELLSHCRAAAAPVPTAAPLETWLTGTRYTPAADGLPEARDAAGLLNPPDLGMQ